MCSEGSRCACCGCPSDGRLPLVRRGFGSLAFMGGWSCWRFSFLTRDGVDGGLLVWAGCEYDAWVCMSVVSGLRVDLWGLLRDEEG